MMLIPSPTYPLVRISVQHLPCAVALRKAGERAARQAIQPLQAVARVKTTSDVVPTGRSVKAVYSDVEGIGPWVCAQDAAVTLGVGRDRVHAAIRLGGRVGGVRLSYRRFKEVRCAAA